MEHFRIACQLQILIEENKADAIVHFAVEDAEAHDKRVFPSNHRRIERIGKTGDIDFFCL